MVCNTIKLKDQHISLLHNLLEEKQLRINFTYKQNKNSVNIQ